MAGNGTTKRLARISGVRGAMARAAVKVAEALSGTALGNLTVDDDVDVRGFRRLTDEKSQRDLDLLSHEQMLKVAHFLYDSDPLGGWLVDQKVDVIMGGEVGYSVVLDRKALKLADDEAVAELTAAIRANLDRFWEHPAHNLRFRADEYLTTYLVSGHLLMPVAGVNAIDGTPELDIVDAANIAGVQAAAASSLVPGVVLVKRGNGQEPKPLKVMAYNRQAGRLEGEAFYFRHSYLANAMRGRSELLRPADYVDSLNQFMFSRIDRAQLLNAMVWDVTLTGANDAQVKTKAEDIRKNPPTKPGSINVHNDSEAWAPMSPDLKGSDSTEEMRSLKNYILGSKSIPESWFGEGGETNRSTSEDQTGVAYKSLQRLQKRARYMFGSMLEFAYDSAQVKQPRVFPKREDGVRLVVDLPPISERDISRLGGVVQNVEAALESAVMGGRISAKTSQRVFLHIVDKLGVPVDADEEQKQIEAETKEREAKQAAAQQAAARAGYEGALGGDDDEPPAPGAGA